MTSYVLSPKSMHEVRADAVLLLCPEDRKTVEGVPAASLRNALNRMIKLENFNGKEGDLITWHAPASAAAGRYMLLGAGPKKDMDHEVLRRLFASIGRRLGGRVEHLAVPVPGTSSKRAELLQAAVEGLILGIYNWSEFITDAKPPRLKKVTFLTPRGEAVSLALQRGQTMAGAANLARDLVCTPPSSLTPADMVQHARKVARRSGLKIKVIDEKQAQRMGMGCLLGVGRGSAMPPRLIHLTYAPTGKKRRKRVALVGKGITFDSGGLSLKPAVSMETMKADMAGSASVLGVMSALRDLKCPVEVHGILAMAENMPSGTAYKPGDILRSMSGKTVEVLNTDAEGRLVLADALEYARQLKPDAMVDVATLTGACVVALGTLCSGVMGFDEKMVDRVMKASRETGEKMWPLPLIAEYRRLLDSKVADIKHIGGRWGGALTAGLFLGDFAGKDIPWAHIDIAGPAFAEHQQSISRVGGTGHPVRTLIRLVEGFA